MDIVYAMEAVPTARGDKPADAVTIATSGEVSLDLCVTLHLLADILRIAPH